MCWVVPSCERWVGMELGHGCVMELKPCVLCTCAGSSFAPWKVQEEVWECHIPFWTFAHSLIYCLTTFPCASSFPRVISSPAHEGLALPLLCIPAGSICRHDAVFKMQDVQLCSGINTQPLEVLCSFCFYSGWREMKQGHYRICLINVTASTSSEIEERWCLRYVFIDKELCHQLI